MESSPRSVTNTLGPQSVHVQKANVKAWRASLTDPYVYPRLCFTTQQKMCCATQISRIAPSDDTSPGAKKGSGTLGILKPACGTDGPSSRTRPGHNPTSSQTKDSPRSKTASWCHFHFHEISTCLLFLAQASPFVASFPSAPPFPLQAVAARPIILLMIPKQNFQFSNCLAVFFCAITHLLTMFYTNNVNPLASFMYGNRSTCLLSMVSSIGHVLLYIEAVLQHFTMCHLSCKTVSVDERPYVIKQGALFVMISSLFFQSSLCVG